MKDVGGVRAEIIPIIIAIISRVGILCSGITTGSCNYMIKEVNNSVFIYSLSVQLKL